MFFPQRFLRFVAAAALVLYAATSAFGQSPGTQTLMVMPFANNSKVPGIEWIGEAFPDVLSQRMAMPQLYLIGRDDRLYAFDRAGVAGTVRPSRATTYAVAEQMDADYVVLGEYDFDGQTFTAKAQILDLKKLRLGPMVQSSGPLTSLIELQTDLAWQLLQQIPPGPGLPRDEFIKSFKSIRLDAFENYIRGILSTNRQQKIRYLREAIRRNPNYTLAMLQLGKVYYDAHEYESAVFWLSKIPKDDVMAGEANFQLGMSEYYRGNYEKAYTAFAFVAGRLPLTEVYNNLGVVEGRRGRRATSLDYFNKAVAADPSDPDYRFNLAVALYKNSDNAGAAQQLREDLQRQPTDAEARALLEAINRGVGVPPASSSGSQAAAMPPGGINQRIPMERIKRNYNEASYRQLELEIHNLTEQRMAAKDRKVHSAYHSDRGRELLARNSVGAAQSEFQEAISLDFNNAAAHAGMARAYEQKGDASNARSEAQTSVRLEPNADAYLVLARLSLKQNQLQAASDAVRQALQLDPDNSTAQRLQQELTAKLPSSN